MAVGHTGDLFLFQAVRQAESVVRTAVRIGWGRGAPPRSGAAALGSAGSRRSGREELGSEHSGILSCATSPDEKKSFARGVYCTFLVARGGLGSR